VPKPGPKAPSISRGHTTLRWGPTPKGSSRCEAPDLTGSLSTRLLGWGQGVERDDTHYLAPWSRSLLTKSADDPGCCGELCASEVV
jgi:hypothetical protein